MVIDAEDLKLMRHAMAWPKQYRNYFVTGPDSDNWRRIQSLVRRGLMFQSVEPGTGGMSTFAVTPDGIVVLKAADAFAKADGVRNAEKIDTTSERVDGVNTEDGDDV